MEIRSIFRISGNFGEMSDDNIREYVQKALDTEEVEVLIFRNESSVIFCEFYTESTYGLYSRAIMEDLHAAFAKQVQLFMPQGDVDSYPNGRR